MKDLSIITAALDTAEKQVAYAIKTGNTEYLKIHPSKIIFAYMSKKLRNSL